MIYKQGLIIMFNHVCINYFNINEGVIPAYIAFA